MTELKITTIKLSQLTKERLEKLKSHRRETFEEILKNVLDLLNTCKLNPDKARAKLLILDKLHKTIGERQ